jgi:phosphoglycerate dehydrogenase-like enzyme
MSGQWKPQNKWDLDGFLSSDLDHKVVGLVGLGAIGKEVARRLASWNVKVVLLSISLLILLFFVSVLILIN